MPHSMDEAFTALPLRPLADAALARARSLGAQHADFRLERVRSASWRFRDAKPAGKVKAAASSPSRTAARAPAASIPLTVAMPSSSRLVSTSVRKDREMALWSWSATA